MNDKILNIITKAMEVNENTKHDVLIQISPHCNLIDINIILNGYGVNKTIDETYIYYYKGKLSKIKHYKEIMNRLEELLDE
jgi:hypothetical protein